MRCQVCALRLTFVKWHRGDYTGTNVGAGVPRTCRFHGHTRTGGNARAYVFLRDSCAELCRSDVPVDGIQLNIDTATTTEHNSRKFLGASALSPLPGA
jgi:hypothetical protein